jgi:hypothetical protein
MSSAIKAATAAAPAAAPKKQKQQREPMPLENQKSTKTLKWTPDVVVSVPAKSSESKLSWSDDAAAAAATGDAKRQAKPPQKATTTMAEKTVSKLQKARSKRTFPRFLSLSACLSLLCSIIREKSTT